MSAVVCVGERERITVCVYVSSCVWVCGGALYVYLCVCIGQQPQVLP